jgi:hypothetical protein
MALIQLTAALDPLVKDEIKIVAEIYKTVPEVKEYLDIFVTAGFKIIFNKYSKEIERCLDPRRVITG